MDPMFGVYLAPFGDVLPLFKWNIYEKLTSSMKWRIIPVASCANKEIRKFQMTLGNYFFPQGDLQTVAYYASFEGKILLL